jgi:RNA recognition motif-containing protein
VAKRIYVGNLPFRSTAEEVRQLFGQYGDVTSVDIVTDRETGRSRGFCFVEMENADDAINALNDYDMDGRKLRVNEARPRGSGGGGGGRSFGGPRY